MLWRAFEWLSPAKGLAYAVALEVVSMLWRAFEWLSLTAVAENNSSVHPGNVSMLWRAFEWLSHLHQSLRSSGRKEEVSMLWRAFEWLSLGILLIRCIVGLWFQCSGELLSGCLSSLRQLPRQAGSWQKRFNALASF
jgi:hypothetical protein